MQKGPAVPLAVASLQTNSKSVTRNRKENPDGEGARTVKNASWNALRISRLARGMRGPSAMNGYWWENRPRLMLFFILPLYVLIRWIC